MPRHLVPVRAQAGIFNRRPRIHRCTQVEGETDDLRKILCIKVSLKAVPTRTALTASLLDDGRGASRLPARHLHPAALTTALPSGQNVSPA